MKGEPHRPRSVTLPAVRPGRLRALRLAARLTQHALARKCGVSVNAVWLVDTDRRQPSLALLRKLKRVLALVPWRE